MLDYFEHTPAEFAEQRVFYGYISRVTKCFSGLLSRLGRPLHAMPGFLERYAMVVVVVVVVTYKKHGTGVTQCIQLV